MRQTYCAEIWRLEQKRYYKDVGLPYSFIQFGNVFCKTDSIDLKDCFKATISYTKKMHELSLKPGQHIEFEAEIEFIGQDDEDTSVYKVVHFKSPKNIKVVEKIY